MTFPLATLVSLSSKDVFLNSYKSLFFGFLFYAFSFLRSVSYVFPFETQLKTYIDTKSISDDGFKFQHFGYRTNVRIWHHHSAWTFHWGIGFRFDSFFRFALSHTLFSAFSPSPSLSPLPRCILISLTFFLPSSSDIDRLRLRLFESNWIQFVRDY
jgi:hypothetical protein